MTEQQLIDAAENGDVSAMKTLANFYAQQTKGDFGDKVGDIVSVKSLDDILKVPRSEHAAPELEAKAYKYYRMAAENSDAESMTETARRIYDGIGTERNFDEANFWYRRAAEAGDPSAMHVVAFSSDDDAEKFKWYKLSAELDKPGLNKMDSIKQTAINFACGRGTEKNLAEAETWLAKLDEKSKNSALMEIGKITGEISWLERAAVTSPEAMIKIAESFVMKNDFVNALTWYKKAAAQGSPDAMSLVGDIFYIGEDGIDQNYAEAFHWYSKAAELDYNMAKVKLTLMICRGLGVEKNLQLAFKTFAKLSWTRENFFGVMRFNSVARFFAAEMVANGEGCEKNLAEAFERYKVAGGVERVDSYESARKIPEALYKVANAYFYGAGVRQNFSKAIKFYERTVNDGEGNSPYKIEAMKKLIWIYSIGEGVPRDESKAELWRENLKRALA